MIIYADILFLLNAVISYVCFISTAYILHLPLKRLRFLFSCLLGGAFALVILIKIDFLILSVLKIAVCFLMCFLAFGKVKFRLFLSSVLLYTALNVLVAGIVLALSMIDKRDFYGNIYISYINISPFTLIVSLGVCYLLVLLFTKIILRRTQRRTVYRVLIEVNGKNYKLFGFCDTGNHLSEPFSALPVCIIKKGIIQGLESLPGQRIIPFSTISDEGVLMGVEVKMVIIDGKKKYHCKTFLAQSGVAFRDLPYDIILNSKIFETENSNEFNTIFQ